MKNKCVLSEYNVEKKTMKLNIATYLNVCYHMKKGLAWI